MGLIGIVSLACASLASCASEPFPNLDDPAVAEFYHQIRLAVSQETGPVLDAQKAGAQGYVLISFVYVGGGKAADVQASGSADDRLSKAGIHAVESAIFPRKPDSMAAIDHYVVQIALTGGNPEISTVTQGSHNKVSFVTGSGPLPATPAAPAPQLTAQSDTPMAVFQAQLQKAVNEKRYYPKQAVLSGEQGVVEVEFDYVGDGKATNITLGKTTATKSLNRAALDSVRDAVLPPKPPELASEMHFHIFLKYTLGQ